MRYYASYVHIRTMRTLKTRCLCHRRRRKRKFRWQNHILIIVIVSTDKRSLRGAGDFQTDTVRETTQHGAQHTMDESYKMMAHAIFPT